MAKSGWEKWRESKKRSAKRKAKKAVKRTHIGYIVIVIVSLVIGLVGGWLGTAYITRNDVFEVKGEKITEYKIGDVIKYTDEGINYVSFGKDLSGEYEIETNMTKNTDGSYTADTSEAGTFTIKYKIKSGRCKGLTLYRAFTVTNGGDAQ